MMVRNYSVRTDLALEERERFEADNVEIQGVVLEEEYDEETEIRITRVEIRTENGAKAMGKPVGTYLTLETPDLALPDEVIHQDIADRLSVCIRELIRRNTGRNEKDLSVLVAGLGNRAVTPDALGPYVADHLNVTRHIIREYGKSREEGDETAVPPAVGSLALSPSLQGLYLCRFLYPLLRVSSSCLCPVSLSRLSRPVFSFPCFSVSPCPAPLFRSLRVSLISPLPASLSAFYLLRLLSYSIFFLSSSLFAPICSLTFFIPASSPHLSSSLLFSSFRFSIWVMRYLNYIST